MNYPKTLPRFGRLLCAWAAMLFLALTGLAQSVGTGVVEGRVLNAATNRYISNARVTVEGTGLEAITNDMGSFRIVGVPVGSARLRAAYSGLDAKVADVVVSSGQTATANFELNSAERYGEVVQLDVFKVASQREFEGNALATNEQRYASNLKVVMAADAFGDVTEGNVGEFLKYLPGITVDYVAADVRTVSVRGFADTFTSVSMDGMRSTSSASGGSARVFEFEQVSINNASRVEVSKVPTPSSPADSLGGAVNLISKSAFERRGSQFNYRGYLSFNSEEMEFWHKTPGPGKHSSYKVLPGFDFDYTLQVNEKLGFVITGLSSNQYNEQHRWQTTWNFDQAGATPQNPYLQQWQLQDGPKNTYRDSVSLKAEFKPSSNQLIAVSVQDNYYKSFFGNRNLNFNVGTNATPTPATGTPLQWGQTFVQSATGRASVTQGSSWRHKMGDTKLVNLRYSLKGNFWETDSGIYAVKSKTWYRELADGHFSNIGTTLPGVSIVRADNIDFPSHDWVVRDAGGNTINPYLLENYRLNTAQNSPVDGKAKMKGAYLNTGRNFDIGSRTLNLKVGVDVREEDKDNRRYQEQWTYVGPDGVANTADDNAGQYMNTNYNGVDPYFGEPSIQWVDPYKIANAFKANPNYFRQATGTNPVGVQAETFRINNSEKITERISSAYVQGSGKFFNNRLGIVTGVRFEKTEDKGEGVLFNPDLAFQRNANGSFVLVNGQRVRRPEAGVAGSMEELMVTRIERGFKADRSYDDYYPSFHANFNLTENLILRFAYAKTLGRPDYADIIPNIDINENDSDPSQPGILTVRNTGLKPWTADNYDLSLEYYFMRGGLASVGFFQKDLQDFWGNTPGVPATSALLQQLGLDDRYLNWTVNSRINVGDAKITGGEFNFVRPLNFAFLPEWARNFSLNANGTMLHLQGPQGVDFRRFISKSGNFSISWNKRPISARLTWNYRGKQKNLAQTGAQYGADNGFFEYYDSRYNIDANLEYTFSKRARLFFNARNILNQPQVLERYSLTSAQYANGYRQEEFGVQFSVGVKGSF